ncbi:glycosyltransferase [Spirillospora sp. NPDC029432]|uniref:glycosyltransferase n=1 Tax=Spirillospora sp. NPDC029432 TaxID=3154599 RepID=UPI003452797A
MTRVLHVITGLGHGGAERQLALLLRCLPVECEVAVLTRAAGPLAEEIAGGGVPVHEIGMRGNRDLTALPRLVRLMRRGRYDVVHTHLYRACVFGRVAARMAGVARVVATEHSLGDGHMEGRRATFGVRMLYRATELLGDVTIAVSPTVAGRLRRWGVRSARLVTIPNSVDPAPFAFDAARRTAVRERLGIGPDAFVIGTVGRLVPTKRLDVLIDAFTQLDQGEPGQEVRLLIVGDGPHRAELERRAAEDARVLFVGDTAYVPGMLAAMDLYASPSTQETFGLSVLEALASGLPVLYTACPALDDLPAPLMTSNAHRLPTWVSAWAPALARHARSGPARRLPVPPAVDHYAVRAHAERLTVLYRGLTRSPSRKGPGSMQELRVLLARAFAPVKGAAGRAGIVLALAVAGLLAGLGYGLFKAPAYSATSYVLIVSQPAEAAPVAVSFAQAYGRLAALPETLAWAADPLPRQELAQAGERIQASTSPDTPLVRLTATAGTPGKAARFANTAADALVRYGNAHQGDTGVRVALMSKAAAPLGPSSPNPPLNVAVGTATGILLGGLAAAAATARTRRLQQAAARPAVRTRVARAAAAPRPKAAAAPAPGETGEPVEPGEPGKAESPVPAEAAK